MDQGAPVRVAGPSRVALVIATGALVALTSGATAFVVLAGTSAVVGPRVELEPRPSVAAPPAQVPLVELLPDAALAEPYLLARPGSGSGAASSGQGPAERSAGTGAVPTLPIPPVLQPTRPQPPGLGAVLAPVPVPVPVPVPGTPAVPVTDSAADPASDPARPASRLPIGPLVPRLVEAVEDVEDEVSAVLGNGALSWSRHASAGEEPEEPALEQPGGRPLPVQAAAPGKPDRAVAQQAGAGPAQGPGRAQTGKPHKSDKSDKSDRSGQAGKPAQTGKAGKAGKSGSAAAGARGEQQSKKGRGGPRAG